MKSASTLFTDMVGKSANRCCLLLLGLTLLLLSVTAVRAERPVQSQSIELPRDTGYMLGDEIIHRLNIKMSQPYKLVADSLPKKGRVSDYAVLNAVRVDKTRVWGATKYNIEFHYQVTNYHKNLVGTMIPAAIVSFASADDVYPVVIKPWGFTVSPYLLSGNRDSGEMPPLLALAQQPTIPVASRIVIAVVAGLLALLLFLPMVQRYLLSPLRARLSRPFHVAHRAIKARQSDRRAELETATQVLHRAFNDTMRRTVLSADLEQFMQLNPSFTAHRQRIERFFAWSDRHFFNAVAVNANVDKTEVDIKYLRELAADLRRCE